MRIPMGNFGNTIAQPQAQARAPGGDPIGQALGNLAGAGQQYANAMQHAEEQKQRAQAATTAATLTNDLHSMHDEIGRGVNDGSIPAAQAVPEFQKRMGELTAERTKDLSPLQRQVIDAHLIQASGALTRNLEGVAVKRTQDETGASLMDLGEQFQRSAMRDLPGSINQWNQSVDTMGPAAGWNPEQITKAKQQFKEGATYNFANATLEGAAETGNIELVRAARQKIEGPDGEDIDPAKRTALITKAYGYENGILAANQRAADKADREKLARENAAVDSYNKAFDLSSQGRYFSKEFIDELSTATAGTTMEKNAQALVQSQAKVAGFASLTLPQQQAELERMRAVGSDPQQGISPIERGVEKQFTAIHDASVKAYAENPWQAAQERGVIRDAPVIELGNIQTAQQVIAQRMAQIGQLEVAAGRKVSPLQPEEAETLGRLVHAVPPDQQSSALATITKLVGDGDRLLELARQIDQKDPVLGTAMVVGDLTTTQGRYVSELVIKGARAIKDKSITIDQHRESGWRAAIATEMGDAFQSQEVRQRIIDAAYYVQAGFSAEGSGTDTSRALRLVVGRIVEHNGSKIPLPRGMDVSDFEKRLGAIRASDLATQAPGGVVYVGKTAVPLDQFVKSLPSAKLVNVSQGKYNVGAGMGMVINSQGLPITIGVLNGN